MLSPFTLCNNDRIVMCYKTSTVYNFQRWPAQWLDWEEALKTATPAASTGQTEWAHFFPTIPATHHTTNASKVEGTGLQSFVSSTIFVWPLANWLPLLQASLQLFAGKTPTSRRRSKSLLNPKTWIFQGTEINKLISHRQKCVDCNVFYFHE